MFSIDTLRSDLSDTSGAGTVLRAAWDAFALAGAVARALAWREDTDPVAALSAAAAADAGRDLLPPPAEGSAPPLPGDVGPGLADGLAEVLDRVRQRLDEQGRAAEAPDDLYALHAAADRAGEAAACLRNLRAA